MHFHHEREPGRASARIACALGLLATLAATFFAQIAFAAEPDEVRALILTGKYAEVIKQAAVASATDSDTEDWPLLLAEASLTTGRYTNAFTVIDQALEKFPYSIRVRLAAYDVFRANGQTARGAGMLEEVNQLAGRRDWAYRDPTNRVALARAALLLGGEPKRVLDLFLNPAKKAAPEYRESYLAIGNLALKKNDFKLAGKIFGEAVQKFPKDAEMHFGLAQAFASGDSEVMDEAIQTTLDLNTNHVGARLLLVDNQIDAEEYAEADEMLKDIERVNPVHPEAWAYRAVLAHLRPDEAAERKARAKALEFWTNNPAVDHLIGKKLSQKYRFAEAAACQRRALEFDPDFLSAKNQLAQDLLRLGDEEEGWKLAEQVNNDDPYDVVAYNLATLKDNLAKFTTLINPHFTVRMEPREAAIYGDRVLDLLERARAHLTEKYGLELTNRVKVEIFDKQKDFAIRTFGLPGGAGFLGVCFGNVITANSPATRTTSAANWEAILWHEFCHVVTLNLTKNKMPRWLSEGISVYEERQANPAWGERLTPNYRGFLLGDELTPVGEMSAAFLKAKNPLMLQFAYYQSSLVVEYLVDHFGLENLRAILADLAAGKPINDTIAAHTAPMKQLEKDFTQFARERAAKTGGDLSFEKPGKAITSSEKSLHEFSEKNPTNYYALIAKAKALIAGKKFAEAVEPLKTVVEKFPEDTGATSARNLLASAYRGLKDEERERETLDQIAALESDEPEVYQRLMELESARRNWAGVFTNAARFLAVNPLVPAPYRFRAEAAEKLGQKSAAIDSYRTALKLDPADPAEVHYRLARLLLHDDGPQAKRHVLQALEEAPRFRDAHRLLLEINGAPQAAVKPPAQP
jgi:tetratricopeptide (TPR) repeat protein